MAASYPGVLTQMCLSTKGPSGQEVPISSVIHYVTDRCPMPPPASVLPHIPGRRRNFWCSRAEQSLDQNPGTSYTNCHHVYMQI